MNLNVEAIQPDAYFKLLSEQFFNSITIFKIREKRLDSEISKALRGLKPRNGKSGATIEVLMPSLLANSPNVRAPFATIQLKFITRENPTINLGSNGTGLTSETLALAVIQTFDGLGSPTYNGGLTWRPAPVAYEALPLEPEEPFISHVARIEADVEFTALPKLPAPQLTGSAGAVTLTDPSGLGAEIYYTTDGSFPGPGALVSAGFGGNALLYTGPFVVTSGTQVNYASYLVPSLYIGSDPWSSTVT